MSEARVIEFPSNRARKTPVTPAKDTSLAGSISRHPSNAAKNAGTTAHFITMEQVIPPELDAMNSEDIAYKCDRLDTVLKHLSAKLSPMEMDILSTHIRQALKTTSEVSYFEGLAEGYLAHEDDDD